MPPSFPSMTFISKNNKNTLKTSSITRLFASLDNNYNNNLNTECRSRMKHK